MSIQRPLILGSCVSRDIFNYYDDDTFELVDYYARTSLISLMGPAPVAPAIEFSRIGSPFQRRMVERDIARHFRQRVARLEFDYLLLDFVDERYDVLEIEPGTYVTVSQEFVQTNFLKDNPLLSECIIASGSIKFKILWYEALRSFLKLADAFGFKSRILLNRVSWAKALDNGETIPGTSEMYTDKNNELLAWMYALVEAELDSQQILQIPQSLFVSTVDHRWGSSPFHYADAYYDYMSNVLERTVRS